jgi:hypothetical protein
MKMQHEIERIPERGDEHWAWGEVTEAVASTLFDRDVQEFSERIE